VTDIHRRPRLLLTGASGFLGRHALAALADTYDIVAIRGRRDLPSELAAKCTEIIGGDINDERLVVQTLRDIDLVCHLAGYVPADHTDPAVAEECLRTNALATLRLAQHSLNARVHRFVYASAGNAYAEIARPAREDDSLFPATRATYYLGSKLIGELYVEHLRLTAGLPALSLRISSIYGVGTPPNSLVARFVAQARADLSLEVHHGGIPAADLVYVADVVHCLRAALSDGEPGVYNVGAGRAWSLLEVARSVVEAWEVAVPVVVKAAEDIVPASFPALCIDKARAAWGYAPASLLEGLTRMRMAETEASS
jgi:UDP-glucose 4-epimerase